MQAQCGCALLLGRAGEAGERSKKAAPMAPMPCANRRTGDVPRERGMRSRLRAHKTFEVHPGSRKGVALTALTTVTCRPAMRDLGAGDKKPRAGGGNLRSIASASAS